LASHGDLALYDFAKEKLASTPPEQIRPQPLLTGHDLIAAGYSAGPRFKQMLSEVEDGQLEGRLTTKEEALEFVLQRFGAPGCV
jgi:poly(A) polymerase